MNKLLAIGYFSVLFFAVIGIRLFPVFNFRISHGYNLDVFAHLSDIGKNNYNVSLLSRFDWWINVIMFLFFPFALIALLPGIRLWKIIIMGVCCSVCIELLQFLFDIGLADINDVISNSIGVLLGCGLIVISVRKKGSHTYFKV